MSNKMLERRFAFSIREVFLKLQTADKLFRLNWQDAAFSKYVESVAMADDLKKVTLFECITCCAELKAKYGSSDLVKDAEKDLDLLKRLPSITRANYGLALVRAGLELQGMMLIEEAKTLDPDLHRNVNFISQLDSAIGANRNLSAVSRYLQ